jgi:hypothetical protein
MMPTGPFDVQNHSSGVAARTFTEPSP